MTNMAETLNGTTESLVNVVNVDRPEAGETVTVAVAPGQRIILGFNTVDAEFAIAGDDFVLLLDDGGLVVFQGLISAAQDAQVPMIQIAGLNIGADIIIEQALALGAEVEPIETAAGEEGVDGNVKSGGGSSYDDSFGDLISALIKQGTIGEMELGSDLAGYGGTEFQIESEFLSDGFLLSDGGSSGLGTGISSASGSPVPSAPTSPSAGGSAKTHWV